MTYDKGIKAAYQNTPNEKGYAGKGRTDNDETVESRDTVLASRVWQYGQRGSKAATGSAYAGAVSYNKKGLGSVGVVFC